MKISLIVVVHTIKNCIKELSLCICSGRTRLNDYNHKDFTDN